MASMAGKVMELAKPKLRAFLYFAKVELIPPSPSEIPEIKNGILKILNGYRSGAWKQLKVRDAFLNTLVATEVFCWFYVGECIGKRHFIGYKLN